MTIQRSHIFGFAGLVVFALALYWAKAEAQAAREMVVSLQKEVDAEHRAVAILEAEAAYIERPDRLEAAARDHLGLVPLVAAKTASLSELDQLAPLPEPQAASSPGATQPPATPVKATP
jgi:hypothetical protein